MKKALETTHRMVNKTLIILFLAVSLMACSGGKSLGEKSELPQDQVAAAFFEAQRHKTLGDEEKAYSAFQEVLAMDESNDAAWYELSRYDFENNKVEAAINKISTAINLDKSNEWYRSQRGTYYLESADYPAAAEDFEWCLNNDSDRLSDYESLTLAYIYANEIEKAVESISRTEALFGRTEELSERKLDLIKDKLGREREVEALNELIAEAPQNPTWYARKYEALMALGNEDEALSALSKGAKLSPGNAPVAIKLAQWKLDKGVYNEALDHLEEALGDPNIDVDAYLILLAEFQTVDATNRIRAFQVINSLIELQPDQINAYMLKSDFLGSTGDTTGALEVCEEILKLDPSQLEVWMQTMEYQRELWRWEDLLITANDALELFPTYPMIYYFKGVGEMNMDMFTPAEQSLKSGEVLIFDDVFTSALFHATLGKVYHMMGDFSDSDQRFEQALSKDGNNAYILNEYAYLLALRKEDIAKAKTYSNQALTLMPEEAAFADTRGWIAFQEEKYQEAKEWISKALNLAGSGDGAILEHYGDVLFKLGQTADAVDYWKSAKSAGNASFLIDQKIADKTWYAE